MLNILCHTKDYAYTAAILQDESRSLGQTSTTRIATYHRTFLARFRTKAGLAQVGPAIHGPHVQVAISSFISTPPLKSTDNKQIWLAPRSSPCVQSLWLVSSLSVHIFVCVFKILSRSSWEVCRSLFTRERLHAVKNVVRLAQEVHAAED